VIFILLSILSSTGIFVIFKLINNQKLPVTNIIVINYLTAFLFGYSQHLSNPIDALKADWIYYAVLIGILFIVFFTLISLSSKTVGISITTVASKMSVIIPILFSILFFKEEVMAFKIIGIVLALIGVFLTIYKKDKQVKTNINGILLPLSLFIGMGVVDSIIKYAQQTLISPSENAFFSSTLFFVAFATGVIYSLSDSKIFKAYLNGRVYLFGILLGLANYGSIYFLIAALNANVMDSSVIFGINNVGIVILSVFIGILIFKEKITKINTIGVLSSIVAIAALSIS